MTLKSPAVFDDLAPVRPLTGQGRWGERAHGVVALAFLALLVGCSTRPPVRPLPPAPRPVVQVPQPQPLPQPQPEAEPVVQYKPVPRPAPAPEPAVVIPALRHATANSARDYRRYGASHIYNQNAGRVLKGQLPSMLYAVGVLNVDIDSQGQVQRLDWARAPKHAPEVMAEIERMVRAAAPFPAPSRMGRVTWTDVWLWDRSGRFQLDTLTEGQRSR